MDDDKFSLGNFDGLGDDLDDLDKDLNAFDKDEQQGQDAHKEEYKQNPHAIETHDGEYGKITNHPTVSHDPQPKFRSPKDNTPLQEIPVDQIVPNEYQPRRVFNQEKLEELARSIKEHGVIQPLVVVNRDDGKFEIVVGERRFRASKLAGLTTVPAFIHEQIDQQTKLEIALIENVQRADLNPIEEAKAYQRLFEEFGLKVSEIGDRVGKGHSTVSNLMRLLKLPAQIQQALVEGELNEGQARPLLSLRTHEEMLEMYDMIRKNDLKVRDIENKVREIKERKIKVRDMFTPDPFLESLENLLRNKLGTRVMVSKKAKGGQITIQFYSDEELNDIINRIA